MESAKRSLEEDATDEASKKADQALEFLLKHACLVAGCNESTIINEKKFTRWGIPEYIEWLAGKELLTQDDKVNFSLFHSWRNPAQHSAIMIHPKQAKQVIEGVETYLSKQRTLDSQGDNPALE